VAQYIRGDGSLATFPTSGGGGASLSYYLNGSVASSVVGYEQMNRVPVIGAGTDYTLNNTSALMAQFLTDVNDPSLLNIPAGAWDINAYFSASNNTGSPTFYVELLKYDTATTTFTSIATGSTELIDLGTTIHLYTTSISVPSTSLTVTDRLVIRVYVNTAGSRTITFHTEGPHLAQIITTFTTGLTALNGLTAQVQSFANGSTGTAPAFVSSTATHTLNIPLASAASVTAGLISNTEFNTFNDKLANVLTTTGDIIYSSSGTTAARLGIGTTGQVLSVVGGIPAWSSAGSGDVTGPASSVDGNFAVFDGLTGKIIEESPGASLTTAGVAVFNTSLALGVASTTTGQLIFRNSANAFTTTIQASASASANANYTWPQAPGTVGQILATDGSGNLSWTAAGAGDMTLAGVQTVTGAKTFGAAGNVGKLILAGSTSGTTILNAGATGSNTLTLPIATSTLACLGLAQTFTAAQTFQAGIALTTAGTFTTAALVASTFTGSVTINTAGSTTTAQLTFGGGTQNWINFGTTGATAPTFTPRSAGTKIVLYPNIGASSLDHAIGVGASSTMWISSFGKIQFFADSGGGSVTPISSGQFEYTSTVRGLNLTAATDTNRIIPQLFINPSGTTAQMISFGQGGLAAPTSAYPRSAGTKIILYEANSLSNLDYAIGVTSSPSNSLWITGGSGSITFFTNNSTTVRAPIDSSGLTLAANCSILMATTGTGGMIGTTTSQLVGFHGTAGTIQRAAAAQAAVATTAATLVTPYGYTTAAQADGIVTLLNEIRTVLVNKGLMKGSA
jgi:hypothetical protein